MPRPLSATPALVAVAALSACSSYRQQGAFKVTTGMTKAQVRQLAGTPYRAGPKCWLYHATKKGTSIDGMRFCFANDRVAQVQTAVHG